MRTVPGSLVLLAAMPCSIALAMQRPSRFIRLGSEDGLSHNSVYAITEDREGFLWIGTVDGLNRYDGYEFRVYRHDPADSTSISNNLVHALLADDHALWVATAEGLDRLDFRRDAFRRYRFGATPPRLAVTALHRDRAGRLWAGTSVGLFRYDARSDSFARASDVFPDTTPIAAVQSDSNGRVWALAGTYGNWTIRRIDGISTSLRLPRSWQVQTFLPDSGGRFWFTVGGPLRLPADRETTPAATSLPAWAILRTGDGTVLIGTSDGLHEWNRGGSRTRHLLDREAAGYVFNWVRALHEDRSGILWVGTHGGLYRRDPNAKAFVHSVADPAAIGPDAGAVAVSTVFERDSVLWLGTFGNGLNRIDLRTGAVRRFRHRAGDRTTVRDNVVWAIHGTAGEWLWIGTGGGLCRLNLRSNRIEWIDLEDGVGGEPRVTDIAEGPDDALWLAGNLGVYRVDPVRVTAETFPLPVANPGRPVPEAILPVDASTVWVGTAPGGLYRLDVSSGRPSWTKQPWDTTSSTEAVWDIHRDNAGTLWLATATGLSRFHPLTGATRWFLHRDGLPGSVVYSIAADSAGRLWLGTNGGLARVDSIDASGTVSIRAFAFDERLANTEFNRHAVFTNRAGEILLGGMAGLTRFRPDQITDNAYRPPIVFTRIETASRNGMRAHNPRGLTSLRLSHREYSLSFELAALSFTNPSQNRYAHYLAGFDEQWTEAGTRRFVRYTNVPPGHYTLMVRGSNNDGIWSDATASLALIITPPFWGTWWFRAALVFAIGLAVFAAFQARVRRLLELERLRLRIAGDLHDDLSGNLSGIAVLADVVLRSPQLGDAERHQVHRIGDVARRTVESLRDIVWFVDPSRDRLDDLVFRMKDLAATILPDVERQFTSHTHHPGDRLSVDFRRQIFLVYKEILHNVARHARATRVSIDVDESGGMLTLRVEDDGRGFAVDAPRQSFGLAGLRRRAGALGGTIDITSRAGAGTTVRVRVPSHERVMGGRNGSR